MALSDMSTFQWLTIGLGAIGFFLTWTGMVVSITRAVTSIKADTAEKIAEETERITERLSDAVQRFEEDQRTQDNRFGEVALAIRQHVSNVEKEMHSIEIWGRDNYVQKHDFATSVQRLEAMLIRFSDEIKRDVRLILKGPAADEK